MGVYKRIIIFFTWNISVGVASTVPVDIHSHNQLTYKCFYLYGN
jgi:hypothetical protein